MGCGGCTIFLAVLYLDLLNRPPNRWSISPRISVWTKDDIGKAQAEDRFGRGADFGNLGILDVAYDERHSLEGRDEDLDEEEDPVIRPFDGAGGLQVCGAKVRKKAPFSSNPYQRLDC